MVKYMTDREGGRPESRPNAKRTDDRSDSGRNPRYDAGRSARGAASGRGGASGSRRTSGNSVNRADNGGTGSRSGHSGGSSRNRAGNGSRRSLAAQNGGGSRSGYSGGSSRNRAGYDTKRSHAVQNGGGSRSGYSEGGSRNRTGHDTRRSNSGYSGSSRARSLENMERVRPQRRRGAETSPARRQRPVATASSRAKKAPRENIYKGAANRQGSAIIFTMLKAACLFALVFILYNSLSGGRLSSVPFTDMQSAVTGAADMNTMQEADNQMIKRLYGLDPASFDGICLYYPLTNMGAEELFLVKLHDTSQQDEVKNAIESRLSTQKKSFEGYGIEQSAMLNRSVSEVRGNYAVFISADDTAPMKNAFDKTY